MKLINKTQCPSHLLLPIIEHAQKSIGTNCEIVKITQSHSERVTGLAIRPSSVKVSLPKYRHDSLSCAYRFWRVLLHEFGHIKDYGLGSLVEFAYYKPGRVNAMRHDDRPHEIRANAYVTEVEKRIASKELTGCDNAILNLAIWMEER